MKENKKMSWSRFCKGFVHAWDGVKLGIKEEQNLRIHILVALLIIIVGFLAKLSMVEWIIIVLMIGLVVAAEIINSAIENICDAITHDYNPYIKKAKDLGAGAVLVLSFVAIVIALLIFLPKLISLYA